LFFGTKNVSINCLQLQRGYFHYKNIYNNTDKITENRKTKIKTKPIAKQSAVKNCAKPIKYSNEIEQLHDYIMNKSSKRPYADVVKQHEKNVKTMTVVNYEKQSQNQNRPVVSCRLNEACVNALVDTGAEINVISKKYFDHKLKFLSDKIHSAKYKTVKCANGTEIKIFGEINLLVQFATKRKYVPFLVANGVKPNVIVGIRTLKALNVDVIVSKNMIKCDGIEIPFLGKVHPDNFSEKNFSTAQF